MRVHPFHTWDVTPTQAVSLQNDLKKRILLERSFKDVRWIAGADCSLDLVRNEACAGVVIFSFPELVLTEQATARKPLVFPYVPGLLTFREGPALLAAFERLQREPDVLFFDGQGVAHPRGMGIASHMGLLLDKPSIGCGKSLLFGRYGAVGPETGDKAELKQGDRLLGYALRTKPKTNPIFVSPGHKIDFESALDLTMKCLDGYRVPKPTRMADAYVARVKKEDPGALL
jgi:deoxyribonuclease V